MMIHAMSSIIWDSGVFFNNFVWILLLWGGSLSTHGIIIEKWCFLSLCAVISYIWLLGEFVRSQLLDTFGVTRISDNRSLNHCYFSFFRFGIDLLILRWRVNGLLYNIITFEQLWKREGWKGKEYLWILVGVFVSPLCWLMVIIMMGEVLCVCLWRIIWFTHMEGTQDHLITKLVSLNQSCFWILMWNWITGLWWLDLPMVIRYCHYDMGLILRRCVIGHWFMRYNRYGYGIPCNAAGQVILSLLDIHPGGGKGNHYGGGIYGFWNGNAMAYYGAGTLQSYFYLALWSIYQLII